MNKKEFFQSKLEILNRTDPNFLLMGTEEHYDVFAVSDKAALIKFDFRSSESWIPFSVCKIGLNGGLYIFKKWLDKYFKASKKINDNCSPQKKLRLKKIDQSQQKFDFN